jgi:membrane protein
LILGATTAFAEMKGNLDQLWGGARKRKDGLWSLVRARLLSFGLVLVLGFLLLVSLVWSAALDTLQGYLGRFSQLTAGRVASFALTLILVTALFCVIFKWLPDRRLPWRPVLLGAGATAIAFMIGRFAIGLYLGNSAIANSFGAAASLIVLLLWTYYSAMIFFLGAEFTRLHAGIETRAQQRPAHQVGSRDHRNRDLDSAFRRRGCGLFR